MADIDAPSFSLGFDLDDDEPLTSTRGNSKPPLPPDSSSNPVILDEDDDAPELGPQAVDSDPDEGPDPPRIFRRLRRGPAKRAPKPVDDDDIESFSSSEEDRIKDLDTSKNLHSLSSSSKASLHGCCVRAPKSSSLSRRGKKEPALGAPTPGSLETMHKDIKFPNLTISPLRRFQLLDSDSDGPSGSEGTGEGVYRIDTYSRVQHSAANDHRLPSKKPQSATTNKENVEAGENSHAEDLWKKFSPINNFDIPTPAFDQVCKEYYQSLNNKRIPQEQGNQKLEQNWDLEGPLPHSHRYFFHHDLRIQKLVQARLPFFLPLGVCGGGTSQQCSVSNINYMDQFKNQEAHGTNGRGKLNNEKGSTSRRKKLKNRNAEDASEGWIGPKTSSGVPKNVGKRRVQVNGQSSGHWYTSPEGKKVYMSKSGQELTGQMAYRHYRKESGAGFRKSRKKSNPKRGKTQN